MIKIQWLASIWCQNDQSNAKLQTRSNYDEFASIWRQNDLKCWVTSQNIQNKAKLQKWSKYNDLHRFDVKTIKATQNSKRDQNYDEFASIWRQNDLKCWVTSQNIQNKAKLQKWSKYNDLHRFDVKTIKATQNSKRDQITMNSHRFDVQTIKNVELRRKPFKTAKLQKWSKYNDLHRFDVKNIKTTLNYESDQIGRQNEQKCWVTSQNIQNNAKLQK